MRKLGWLFVLMVSGITASGAPASTVIDTRLLTPISSYHSKPGDKIEALIATPVCSGLNRVIPPGSTVRGAIVHVSRVGLGLLHETAKITLEFRELDLPGEEPEAIEARLAAIDNARERIDKHGVIHGIRATSTMSNRAGERLVFLVMEHHPLVLPFFAVENGIFHFAEPEIVYPTGTELDLDVRFPESLGAVSRCSSPAPAIPAGEFAPIVDALPYWSYSKRQRMPMDLVNLAFIGSGKDIDAAFAAAGWNGSQPNSMKSGLGAIRAIAEDRSFADAPMRTLTLNGAEQDLSYQKTLDTFEKRHHVRMWKEAEQWRGQTVWASAATRDLFSTFSIHPFGFTHQIQDNVDLERDKIVSDLEFAGCVNSVAYVPRPEAVRASGYPYRKGVNTDSRVAVVLLKACEPGNPIPAAAIPPPPPKIVRYIRRVTLTARNHFIRDNIFYRAADDLRIGWRTAGHWKEEHRNEQLARKIIVQQTSAAGN